MCHGQETGLPCGGKYVLKFGRRVADFARIQSDADDVFPIRHGLRQRFECVLFRQMAQETHNQRAAYAPFLMGIVAGAADAVQHGFKCHPARGMRLRIEKDFGADDIIFAAAQQVGAGQVVKILFVQQNGGGGIVNVEKRLQVVEIIGGAHFVHIGIGNADAVAPGDFKHKLRLERALDMDVQLGFG